MIFKCSLKDYSCITLLPRHYMEQIIRSTVVILVGSKMAFCQKSFYVHAYICKSTAHCYENIVDQVHGPVLQSCSLLAFVLDQLLPQCQNAGDKDCPALARVFLASIASCTHCPEAQTTLVSEVKAALQRALALPESAEKHSRVQAIMAIISTIIEACPNPPGSVPNSVSSRNPRERNWIFFFSFIVGYSFGFDFSFIVGYSFGLVFSFIVGYSFGFVFFFYSRFLFLKVATQNITFSCMR